MPYDQRSLVVTLPPVVAIIATRGDRADLLDEAVASVLAQDYAGPVGVVVVYDCDELPEATVRPAETAGRSVRWIHNTRVHGLASARNAGVAEASADLVAFLDDDDVWLPGKLTAQVALLQEHPSAPLASSGIEILDTESGRRVPRPSPAHSYVRADLLRDRVAELHPSTFLLRREAFDRVGGVDTRLPGGYAEDYDFLLRIAELGPLVAVREPLTVVRWTGQSYFFSRWKTISEALRYLLRQHPDFADFPAGWSRIQGQIAFAEAAMGNRRRAARTAVTAWRRNPREMRAPLALLVSTGAVSADTVQRLLHRRGRGI